MKLVFIFAALVFLKVDILYRTYHLLSLAELKRRARDHNPQAIALYKVAANNRALDVLLYAFGLASAGVLLIMSARAAWWLCVITIVVMAWIIFWAPNPSAGGIIWRFCAATARYVFKLLSWLLPVLNFIARLIPGGATVHAHTGAYEKEDLLDLIKNQATQIDNRIPEEDLKIAAGALTFGDKTVAKVMTPRRTVKFVSEDEVVGPILIDELHKTGFSRFPVIKGSAKSAAPSVVGTLFLKDIIEVGQENKGKVRDHMKKGAYFINEVCNLQQALDAILKNHHHQLVVVNNFEEMVGVITLEDILEQILGQPVIDEFDQYDNLRAVAGLEAHHEHAHHHEVEAPASEVETQPGPATAE